MTTLNYLLLAVADPQKSARLYDAVLGAKAVENSPTFVLYVLPSGLKIGLWLKDEMEPDPGVPGGSDISFSEPDKAAVRATYDAWKALGPRHPAGAGRHGLRLHLHRGRSRRSPAAGVHYGRQPALSFRMAGGNPAIRCSAWSMVWREPA